MIQIRYTRNLFLRAMCVVYLFAFLSLYIQIPGKFCNYHQSYAICSVIYILYATHHILNITSSTKIQRRVVHWPFHRRFEVNVILNEITHRFPVLLFTTFFIFRQYLHWDYLWISIVWLQVCTVTMAFYQHVWYWRIANTTHCLLKYIINQHYCGWHRI